MVNIEAHEQYVIANARIARLATIDKSQPYLVPVVFVLHEGSIFIPTDEKSKKVRPEDLKRVRNIRGNPNVALLIDEYHDDWNKLFYIMILGKGRIVELDDQLFANIRELLISKYPQYKNVGMKSSFIVIRPEKVISWKNEMPT
jgi:PPOX class probable F420-dependent enzyme